MTSASMTNNLADRCEGISHIIHCIADKCEDEVDRVYLGSTNDAHTLVRQARALLEIAAALRAKENQNAE